jgi:hypothetical protein
MSEQRYTREDHEAYRREVAAQEEREARERKEATREAARKAWLADGGSPRRFESAWEGLQEEQRKERLREASTAARQAQRSISTI